MSTTRSDQPLISVVMPVYNVESFVGAAMESILHQTYPRFELIVVDDGSADYTWDIIETLAARDPRVRPIAAKHGGQAAALNAGIAAARGDYIALMDADDLALPERLAAQLDFLQRTGADICGACAQAFGADSKVLWFPESHAAICCELLFRCALLHPTVLMRADVPQANKYLAIAVFQDYELWTRLASRYRLANCPRVLVRYRCHLQQNSRTQKARSQEDMGIYRRRYFFSLFPEASQGEFECFERLALQKSHPTLADLERAGAGPRYLALNGRLAPEQTAIGFCLSKCAAYWEAVGERLHKVLDNTGVLRSSIIRLGSIRDKYRSYAVEAKLRLTLMPRSGRFTLQLRKS